MAPTIDDVAERSGVSTATVSRALRGLPNVAPSTRERVLRAAEELNYAIDSQASRLASGRSMTIGLFMPLADQWFYGKVSTAAETILLTQGYDVMRFNVPGVDMQTQYIRQIATSRRVDGIIVFTISLSEQDLHIIREVMLPSVTVETTHEGLSSVTIDNVKAAEMATHHLLNLGHTDIAIIGGLEDDPMRFSVPLARRQGYLNALFEHGIEARDELMVSGNFSAAGGAEAMTQLISIRHPPTAVFAFSDEMAVGAMRTIRDMGLRIPEEVSVVGFDDHDLARYLDLTTVQQPVAEFGEQAANMLLGMLGQEEDVAEPITQQLPFRLMVRATTGPVKNRTQSASIDADR